MKFSVLGMNVELTSEVGCKKVDYKNFESAKRAADAMNTKPSTRNELEPYRCQFCDGWHIGRKQKASKEKNMQELIAVQKEYIELLGKAIDQSAVFLHVHGFITASDDDFKKGEELRNAIEDLTDRLR